MKFGVTYDADHEAGLDEVMSGMNDALQKDFSDRFYDDSEIGLYIVLMCRDPMWNFKQRIRFVKGRNRLYVDIMLDLDTMSRSDLATRRRIVGEKIVHEIPQIVAKYKFKDFDLLRFTRDLREWFEFREWIAPPVPKND